MSNDPSMQPGHPRLPGAGAQGYPVPAVWGPMSADPGLGRPAGSTFDPRLVMNAIRRHWHVVFPLGIILATVAAGVVWIRWEPQYRAETWLEIRDKTDSILRNSDSQGGKFVTTQIELLRSQPIINDTLENPDVAEIPDIQRRTREEALRWIRKRLDVRSVNGSELFTVGFTAPNGTDAAKIANAVVHSFLGFRNKREAERKERFRKELQKQRIVREEEVKKIQGEIQKLAQAATGETLPLTSKTSALHSFSSPLATLFERAVEKEVEFEVMQAQQKAYADDQTTLEPVPDALLDNAIVGHPDIVQLNRHIEAQKQNLERARAGSAYHRRLTEDLAKSKAELTERSSRLRPDLEEQLKDAMERERRSYAAELKDRLQHLAQQKDHLSKRINAERLKMKRLAGKSFELEFTQDDLLRKQAVLRQIVDRSTFDEIEEGAPDRITVVETAVAQSLPLEKSPFKRLGLAALIAFAVPFSACVLIEWIRQPISSPECLVQICQQHVIGEIATLPTRPLLNLLSGASRYRRHRAVFEDSVDSLRTALAISNQANQTRAIVVASAVSGEGKSNLASQLAMSWARCSNDPVLVVDADLRDPDLHNLFDVEIGPGLGDVLAGKATLEEAIIRDWSENIHILPAGELYENTHRAFSDARFADLLDQMRSSYRLIIIDVAPVLPASESLVISKAADGVLLCVLRDVSRGPQVRMALERLQRGGANVLGTVLAGTPVQRYTYRYGAYSS